jgi:hypothetical protein
MCGLELFNRVQSIEIIFIPETPIVPFLTNKNLLKLAPEPGHNPGFTSVSSLPEVP